MVDDTTLDAYGFPATHTPAHAEALARCDAYQQRRERKWQVFYAQRQLPPASVLKRYCRKGVPPSMRRWVWPQLCGADVRRRRFPVDYYRQLLDGSRAAHAEAANQIELDLPRTFPGLAWLHTDDGQSTLRRVLTAMAVHAPRTGYCQGMNYVGALLLAALDRDEEGAFWIMVALMDTDGLLYQDMFVADLVGTQVELRSLQDLLSRKNARLHRHLQRLGADTSLLATDWFLCLYATALPPATVLRVWDALLLEGPKVLYRVALAILAAVGPELLRIDNAGEVLMHTKRYTAQLHDRDALLRAAFTQVGSLPMKRIVVLRAKRATEVQDEQVARQAARQVAEAKRVAAAAARQAEKLGADEAGPLAMSVSTSVALHGAESRVGKSVDDIESTASRTDLSTVGQTVGASSFADFEADAGGVASHPVRPTTTE